jgi:hypothetical protein
LLEKGGNCRLKVTSMKHCSTSLRFVTSSLYFLGLNF